MPSTSLTLLQRLGKREDEAWGRFVELYTPLFFHWARQAGLQQADAADLVQEVLVLLVQKLPEFEYDPHRSFRGWLRTVTENKWRELTRRKREIPAEVDGLLSDLASPDGGPQFAESEYRSFLTARALQVMQAEFEPNTWKACWLQVMEGKSGAETAHELGISEGAVRTAKFRVLSRLRQELGGFWGPDSEL